MLSKFSKQRTMSWESAPCFIIYKQLSNSINALTKHKGAGLGKHNRTLGRRDRPRSVPVNLRDQRCKEGSKFRDHTACRVQRPNGDAWLHRWTEMYVIPLTGKLTRQEAFTKSPNLNLWLSSLHFLCHSTCLQAIIAQGADFLENILHLTICGQQNVSSLSCVIPGMGMDGLLSAEEMVRGSKAHKIGSLNLLLVEKMGTISSIAV